MTQHVLHLTSGFVKDALRGKAKVIAKSFDATRHIRRVSTDSRSIQPGDLFVALEAPLWQRATCVN
jgi:UDP-N-acetylmuramyl pentapeptide synthase